MKSAEERTKEILEWLYDPNANRPAIKVCILAHIEQAQREGAEAMQGACVDAALRAFPGHYAVVMAAAAIRSLSVDKVLKP